MVESGVIISMKSLNLIWIYIISFGSACIGGALIYLGRTSFWNVEKLEKAVKILSIITYLS